METAGQSRTFKSRVPSHLKYILDACVEMTVDIFLMLFLSFSCHLLCALQLCEHPFVCAYWFACIFGGSLSVRRLLFYSAKDLTFKGEILLRKKNQGRYIQLTRKRQRSDMVRKRVCPLRLVDAVFLKIALVYVFWGGETCQDLSGRSSKI